MKRVLIVIIGVVVALVLLVLISPGLAREYCLRGITP